MELVSSVRFRNDKGNSDMVNKNYYQGMVDKRTPDRSKAEEARDRWVSNSYPHNYIVLLPLALAKYLLVNDALEDKIIRETASFSESMGSDEYLEGIQLEFRHKEGSLHFAIRYMLASPVPDNRWSMKKTFNYTLPEITSDTCEDFATLLIDAFTSRRFLQNKDYEWFKGTDQNVHSHSKSDSTALHRTLTQLLQEDCQITLQRFPMMLKSLDTNGSFAQAHGNQGQAWSVNTVFSQSRIQDKERA